MIFLEKCRKNSFIDMMSKFGGKETFLTIIPDVNKWKKQLYFSFSDARFLPANLLIQKPCDDQWKKNISCGGYTDKCIFLFQEILTINSVKKIETKDGVLIISSDHLDNNFIERCYSIVEKIFKR